MDCGRKTGCCPVLEWGLNCITDNFGEEERPYIVLRDREVAEKYRGPLAAFPEIHLSPESVIALHAIVQAAESSPVENAIDNFTRAFMRLARGTLVSGEGERAIFLAYAGPRAVYEAFRDQVIVMSDGVVVLGEAAAGKGDGGEVPDEESKSEPRRRTRRT